jgi:tryptophanyl-tRNA synthetase
VTRVFSGIQPTGQKHIGNLLGAIRHYVADQEELGGEAIFCVVDLHSMTLPYDPAELRRYTLDTACLLMAAGLDPDRSILFAQSHVPEHAELAWVLNCVASMGELAHDPVQGQGRGPESVSVGLFDLPRPPGRRRPLPTGPRGSRWARTSASTGAMRGPGRARVQRALRRDVSAARGGHPRTAARIADPQEPTRKMRPRPAARRRAPCMVLDEPAVVERKIKRAVTDSGGEVVARRTSRASPTS